MSILVASVPSGHVYVRHLAPPPPAPADVVRLPDPPSGASPDSPWWPPRMLTSAWVHGHAAEFDLMHVHFGFDAVSPADLEALTLALRQHDKPLVLTVHDLRNPHHPTAEAHDAQLDVLVAAADALLTLTPGAAAVIEQRWGRTATVVPHPHVVPEEVLVRPRPPRDRFVVGLHAKSLRANMEPLALVDGVVEALASMPGAVLRVDAHTDVMTEGFARHDAGLAAHLTALADDGLLDLRVHDYFSDDELWAYLQGLDVSVLPYRFGTHSGWLEACHDLGTWVAAPDCGFYAQQRPCLTYAADGPERVPSLVAALRDAHRGWLEGRPGPRATAEERRAEREQVAAVHHDVYQGVLGRRRACTS